MLYTMANLQRIVISVLLILTATFVFLAQSTHAAKGPKITNTVRDVLCCDSTLLTCDWLGLL